MKKITAEIASNRVDSQGDKYSDECLEDIKKQINKNSIPIIYNNYKLPNENIVGRVTKAKIENGKVIIEGEIEEIPRYLTPGFYILNQNKKGEIREITSISLVNVSLTNNPTDKSLKQIEIDEKDK